jgi:methylglyoxal synthase
VDRCIALIAHDGRKAEMVALARANRRVLARERLVATGTTGNILADQVALRVERALSGPLGGDLQIGARVASGEVKMVVFLRDPLTAHPHDPDIQALLKVCDVHRVPLATNVATARILLGSLATGGASALVERIAVADGLADDED